MADRLGDPTAKQMGRLSLNPLRHVDPFGTIILPIMLVLFSYMSGGRGIIFGWAKPVPINPYNFRNPKRDMALSAAGGPVTNLALALISTILLKIVIVLSSILPADTSTMVLVPLSRILEASMWINVVLAVFNMIPVPPLDGGRVLIGLLPDRHAIAYSRIEPYGMMIIILLLFTGIAGKIIVPLILLILSIFNLLL